MDIRFFVSGKESLPEELSPLYLVDAAFCLPAARAPIPGGNLLEIGLLMVIYMRLKMIHIWICHQPARLTA
jgi:hypothetical protein